MQEKKITKSKAIRGIILSIADLAVAQLLAFGISELLAKAGVNATVCNIITGVLYIALALAGIKLLCEKVLKVSMEEMRISNTKIKGIWFISALLMPLCVIVFATLIGGEWTVNAFDTETAAEIITSAIFFYGFGAGIVEEAVFRGIIMGCTEKCSNIKLAVIMPSILFAAVHIIGSDLDFISVVQLLIAGSIVGILFSLIAYESNSIWNSAIVHAVWNMFFVGDMVHIGKTIDNSSIFNFVLENKSFILTGGDFGIEASVISIVAYLIFIIAAAILLHRKNRAFTKNN